MQNLKLNVRGNRIQDESKLQSDVMIAELVMIYPLITHLFVLVHVLAGNSVY